MKTLKRFFARARNLLSQAYVWTELKAMAANSRMLWLVLRCVFIDPSIEKVRDRRYPDNQVFTRIPTVGLGLEDLFLEQAIRAYNQQSDSSKGTDDKQKQLLSLISLSFSIYVFTIGYLHKLSFKHRWIEDASLFGVVLLLSAFYLSFSYFAIGRVSEPVLDGQFLLTASETDFKIDLANDYLYAEAYNKGVQAFKLDLYRAASRYMTWGAIVLALAAGFLIYGINDGPKEELPPAPQKIVVDCVPKEPAPTASSSTPTATIKAPAEISIPASVLRAVIAHPSSLPSLAPALRPTEETKHSLESK